MRIKVDPAAQAALARAIPVWKGEAKREWPDGVWVIYELAVYHAHNGRLVVVITENAMVGGDDFSEPLAVQFMRERQLVKFGRRYGITVPNPLIRPQNDMPNELRAALAIPAGGRGWGGLFGGHRSARQIRLVRDYLAQNR